MDGIAVDIGRFIGMGLDPRLVILGLFTAAIPLYRFAPLVNALGPTLVVAAMVAASADDPGTAFINAAVLRYPLAVLWCWLIWSMKKKGSLAFW